MMGGRLERVGQKINRGKGGRSNEKMCERIDARMCGGMNEGIGYIV